MPLSASLWNASPSAPWPAICTMAGTSSPAILGSSTGLALGLCLPPQNFSKSLGKCPGRVQAADGLDRC